MRIEEKGTELVIVDFDEIEAYKIAEKIEKDGIEFYQKLLDTVTSPKSKEILNYLLKEEYAHLKFFGESIFRLRSKKEETSEDEDVLNSMDYGIFCLYENLDELKNILNNPKKAVRLGIVIEDKSTKFYESCKAHIESQAAKKELDVVIDEESKHRQMLEDMLNHLEKGGR